MSLTGWPLIFVVLILAVVVAVVTVRRWRVPGRWRLAGRVTGVLVLEILVVASVGLVVNRTEQFYPSWQALVGSDRTVAEPAQAATGQLDGQVGGGSAIRWSPPEGTGWRLSGPPALIVPSSYHQNADRTFPVIVVLTSTDRVAGIEASANAATDFLTVVLVPTRRTTAARLATLPGRLAKDLRTAATGWAIVADGGHAALARQWQARVPARFRTVTGAFDAAVGAMPAPLRAPMRLPS